MISLLKIIMDSQKFKSKEFGENIGIQDSAIIKLGNNNIGYVGLSNITLDKEGYMSGDILIDNISNQNKIYKDLNVLVEYYIAKMPQDLLKYPSTDFMEWIGTILLKINNVNINKKEDGHSITFHILDFDFEIRDEL